MKQNNDASSTNKYMVFIDDIIFVLENAKTLILSNRYSPDVLYSFLKFLNDDSEIRYLENEEICPKCGSELVKNGTSARQHNKYFKIRYQTYQCKNKDCEKYHTTSSNDFKEKWNCYSYEFKKKSAERAEILNVSYEQKSELIELETGNKVPRNTLYQQEVQTTNEILEKDEKIVQEVIKNKPEYFSAYITMMNNT